VPDIFDQIDASSAPQQQGDIFDQVAAKQSQPDIFDQIESEGRYDLPADDYGRTQRQAYASTIEHIPHELRGYSDEELNQRTGNVDAKTGYQETVRDQLLNPTRLGLQQVARGFEHLTNTQDEARRTPGVPMPMGGPEGIPPFPGITDEQAQGANDLISGSLDLAAPGLLVGGALFNPVGTAATIGIAAVTGKTAKDAALNAGFSPEKSELIGNISGLAAGLLVPEGARLADEGISNAIDSHNFTASRMYAEERLAGRRFDQGVVNAAEHIFPEAQPVEFDAYGPNGQITRAQGEIRLAGVQRDGIRAGRPFYQVFDEAGKAHSPLGYGDQTRQWLSERNAAGLPENPLLQNRPAIYSFENNVPGNYIPAQEPTPGSPVASRERPALDQQVAPDFSQGTEPNLRVTSPLADPKNWERELQARIDANKIAQAVGDYNATSEGRRATPADYERPGALAGARTPVFALVPDGSQYHVMRDGERVFSGTFDEASHFISRHGAQLAAGTQFKTESLETAPVATGEKSEQTAENSSTATVQSDSATSGETPREESTEAEKGDSAIPPTMAELVRRRREDATPEELHQELTENQARLASLNEKWDSVLGELIAQGIVTRPEDLEGAPGLAQIDEERRAISARNQEIRQHLFEHELSHVPFTEDEYREFIKDFADANKFRGLMKTPSIERGFSLSKPYELHDPRYAAEVKNLAMAQRAKREGLLEPTKAAEYLQPHYRITAPVNPETIRPLIERFRKLWKRQAELVEPARQAWEAVKDDEKAGEKRKRKLETAFNQAKRWEYLFRRNEQLWRDEYERITGEKYVGQLEEPARPGKKKREAGQPTELEAQMAEAAAPLKEHLDTHNEDLDERKRIVGAALDLRISVKEDAAAVAAWEKAFRPLLDELMRRSVVKGKTITPETKASEMSPAEFLTHRPEQALKPIAGWREEFDWQNWNRFDLRQLKLDQLQVLAKLNGLPHSGTKEKLIERMLLHQELKRKYGHLSVEDLQQLPGKELDNILAQLGASKFGNKKIKATSILNTFLRREGHGNSLLARANHKLAVEAEKGITEPQQEVRESEPEPTEETNPPEDQENGGFDEEGVESESSVEAAGSGTRTGGDEGTDEAEPRQLKGSKTSVILSEEDQELGAEYAVWELRDVHASHSGLTFQPNPRFELVNERRYDDQVNQGRVLKHGSEAKFKARLLITDNPDALNGPPVIDHRGNTVAGNSRVMTLEIIYNRGEKAAQSYRDLLIEKASQFGLNPAEVAKYQQPVLVRVVPEAEMAKVPGAAKWAIRKTNVSNTAALTQSEQASADAGQLSEERLREIGEAIEERGEDATLNDALSGPRGLRIVNGLIDDGFFSEGERPKLQDDRTKAVTPYAKDRIAKAMLGKFFRDAAQIQTIAPSIRQKLERLAAPLARVSFDPAWDLTAAITDALDLIEYANAHGLKNPTEVLRETDLFGNNPWSPRTVFLAQWLVDTKPNDVVKAVREYASERATDDERNQVMMPGFPEPHFPTPEEAFEKAFGGSPSAGEILRDMDAGYGSADADLRLNGFYSHLEHVIDQKVPNKVSPKQAIAILTNPQNGVKKDELEWSGLLDWLKGMEGWGLLQTNISKQDILSYALENRVSVREMDWQKQNGSTSYGSLTLHGEKSNYRELLFILGPRPTAKFRAYRRYFDELQQKYGHRIIDGGEPGQYINAYGERVPWHESDFEYYPDLDPLTREERDKYRRLQSDWYNDAENAYRIYRPPHFDGQKNVLAHVRFDDRLDSNGDRVLMVEEIQSDWHQAGRKEGYRTPANEQKVADLRKEIERLTNYGATPQQRAAFYQVGSIVIVQGQRNRVLAYEDNELDDQHPVNTQESYYTWRVQLEKVNLAGEATQMPRWTSADPTNSIIAPLRAQAQALEKGVADAPFKTNWEELVFKRMVRYAAEKGYAYVAWTTGKQQIKRYNLAQHVAGIAWAPIHAMTRQGEEIPPENDTGLFYVLPREGAAHANTPSLWRQTNNPVTGDTYVRADQLPEFIGAEAARALLARPLENGPHASMWMRLTGRDLQVGPTGMQGFYDKEILNFAAKFGRKFGAKPLSLRLRIAAKSPGRRRQFQTEFQGERYLAVIHNGEEAFLRGPWAEAAAYYFRAHDWTPLNGQHVRQPLVFVVGNEPPEHYNLTRSVNGSTVYYRPGNGIRPSVAYRVATPAELYADDEQQHEYWATLDRDTRELVGRLHDEDRSRREALKAREPGGLKVHALPITEKMRATVMFEGLPLFASKGRRPLQQVDEDPNKEWTPDAVISAADWEVEEARPGVRMRRRPARMRVNTMANALIEAATGEQFSGAAMTAAQARLISQRLAMLAFQLSAKKTKAASIEKVYKLARAFSKLAKLADKAGGMAYVLEPETFEGQEDGATFRAIKQNGARAREELTHVQQGEWAEAFAGDDHENHLPFGVLRDRVEQDHLYQQLLDRVRALDPVYDQETANNLLLEVTAKLIAGRFDQLGIEDEEDLADARRFLAVYHSAIARAHGERAADELFRYADPEVSLKLVTGKATNEGLHSNAGRQTDTLGNPRRTEGTAAETEGLPQDAEALDHGEGPGGILRDAKRTGSLFGPGDEDKTGNLFDATTESDVNQSAERDENQLERERLTAQLNAPLSRDEQLRKLKKSKRQDQSALFEDNSDPQNTLFSGLGALHPYVMRLLRQDVVPTAKQVAEVCKLAGQDLPKVFAPASRGVDAKDASLIVRHWAAELQRLQDRAMATLAVADRFFQGQTETANLDFMDRMEAGQAQPTPELQTIADTIRQLLDNARDEIRNLGTGKLERFLQDYFPHIWKKPELAKQLQDNYRKRPIQGSKAFLKKRTLDTIQDGIQAGLEPISYNPVELVLHKLREMYKYLTGTHILKELREQKLLLYVDARDAKPPVGWQKIEDPAATVYGPSIQQITEFPNEGLWNALNQVAQALGIQHDRGFKDLHGAVGRAYRNKPLIETKHGTAEDVVAHEIGHQIDFRAGAGKYFLDDYPDAQSARRLKDARRTLRDKSASAGAKKAARKEIADLAPIIQQRKKFFKELRDLADLRQAGSQAYHRKREEKMALLAEMWVGARELFAQTAPTVYAEWRKFLGLNPALHALRDIKGNTEVVPISQPYDVGGLVIKGHWWAPEPAARVVNNYLSPSLREKSGIVRGLMSVGNFMNQAQLGFSGFHAVFTGLEAVSSALALAIYQGAHGDLTDAGKTAITAALAPITTFRKGRTLEKEWYAPGTQGAAIQQLVEAMVLAGGRAHQESFYQTHIARKMVEAWRQNNVFGAFWRAPFAAFELPVLAIMEKLVPRLKMGAFAQIAQYELERLGANADPKDVQKALADAWDSIDNRFGQLTYDNLFWHRYTKDIALLTVRSPGWNVGDLRELAGGALDTGKAAYRGLRLVGGGSGPPPKMTHRMAYIPAHWIVSATVGAILYYIWHRRYPHKLVDVMFPPDERQHRWSPATYVRDEYNWTHDPVQTASGKVNPLLKFITEALTNKDGRGRKIRDGKHHWPRELKEFATWAAEQQLPFWLEQNLNQKDHKRLEDKLLPEVGITRAPKAVGKR
jgi:hypothetical protein